jgi:hypothetical protein
MRLWRVRAGSHGELYMQHGILRVRGAGVLLGYGKSACQCDEGTGHAGLWIRPKLRSMHALNTGCLQHAWMGS